jgi:hypothetical protein
MFLTVSEIFVLKWKILGKLRYPLKKNILNSALSLARYLLWVHVKTMENKVFTENIQKKSKRIRDEYSKDVSNLSR